ncbi:hypothetical protein ACP70R_047443 [Stipagrostis hirtigluma subsp. patula]
MWEGGGVHGSHEALLLQAAGGAGDHGHAGPGALLPWLGPAATPSSYPFAPPGPFGADAVGPFGFGAGGYCEGGGVGQYGLFGLEPPPQQHQHGLVGGGGGAAPQHHGSRVVSGLLGTLQAELGRMTAKEIMDAKALAASRSHSEAERRRRQRINGHLAKLRSLLPNTTKTDKASLLAEVIEHVKELKRQTSAVLGVRADELAVEAAEDGEGRLLVRASLCCEDRAGLIPDIARALAALRLRARRAEIATLGGRVRNVLLIAADDDEDGGDGRGCGDDEDGDADGDGGEDGCVVLASHRRHELVASIQEALRGVMDRKAVSSGGDTSSSGGGSIKRQRMSGGHEQGSL